MATVCARLKVSTFQSRTAHSQTVVHNMSTRSYFTNIKQVILPLLNNATESVIVCMAWLTDPDLMSMLIKKLEEGLRVEICLLEHKSNRKSNNVYKTKIKELEDYWADLQTFQKANGRLNIVPPNLGFIHHKFAVIDNTITITGSYNWSKNAANNRENIVVIESSSIAKQFTSEFEEITSINQEEIIAKNFPKCSMTGCRGNQVKIKIIDCRNTTKYFQNETYIIGYCTSQDSSHLKDISENTETDYIGDLMDEEYHMLEVEIEDLNQEQIKRKSSLIKRRVDSQIAWSLDSRLDVFVENGSHNLLGVYKITRDMEGYDELKTIWEHDLIKKYFIETWEQEIIDFINDL